MITQQEPLNVSGIWLAFYQKLNNLYDLSGNFCIAINYFFPVPIR
jgi:hypothetical protein